MEHFVGTGPGPQPFSSDVLRSTGRLGWGQCYGLYGCDSVPPNSHVAIVSVPLPDLRGEGSRGHAAA